MADEDPQPTTTEEYLAAILAELRRLNRTQPSQDDDQAVVDGR